MGCINRFYIIYIYNKIILGFIRRLRIIFIFFIFLFYEREKKNLLYIRRRVVK